MNLPYLSRHMRFSHKKAQNAHNQKEFFYVLFVPFCGSNGSYPAVDLVHRCFEDLVG